MLKLSSSLLIVLVTLSLMTGCITSYSLPQLKSKRSHNYYKCYAYNRISHDYYMGTSSYSLHKAQIMALRICHTHSRHLNVCLNAQLWPCSYIDQNGVRSIEE